MRSLFSFRSVFTVLTLVLALTLGGQTALGQGACIDDCLAQLNICINQSEPLPEGVCEDRYDACVESCLSGN